MRPASGAKPSVSNSNSQVNFEISRRYLLGPEVDARALATVGRAEERSRKNRRCDRKRAGDGFRKERARKAFTLTNRRCPRTRRYDEDKWETYVAQRRWDPHNTESVADLPVRRRVTDTIDARERRDVLGQRGHVVEVGRVVEASYPACIYRAREGERGQEKNTAKQ
jgi:hypothetical protein